MDEIDNNTGETASVEFQNVINSRVLRSMAIAVGLAVTLSVPFASTRVTMGLLVGGLLSLLNYHWMQTSISAAFGRALGIGTKPQLTLARYALRYFLIAAVVFAAYKLNIVDLPATIAGLCSFVIALFVEAFREFYFVIIHREETS